MPLKFSSFPSSGSKAPLAPQAAKLPEVKPPEIPVLVEGDSNSIENVKLGPPVHYPRPLGTFNGESKQFVTTAFEESENGKCYMDADYDVDVDGSGSSHGDPYFQPDTTLHHNGKALNSDEVSFIVLPPPCIRAVKGVVLGCLARVTYKKRSFFAVVGDVGPTRKVGEGSYKLAKLLGMNPSPIDGGEDFKKVLYEWWPGQAAVVDGVTYTLQPYRA